MEMERLIVRRSKKSTAISAILWKIALRLAKETARAKFDETVELAIRLGVDPRQADQNIRGTVTLPHGMGKTVRVLAFAKGEKEKEAQEAGADFVGSDELIKKISEGWFDFDKAVATPDMMAAVGRIGKDLGPARPDAQSKNRHGRRGYRQGGQRNQSG